MWYSTIVLGSGEELKGDATSGVLELKLIWFRFAAPSHKHSQVEYTRYCNNHCLNHKTRLYIDPTGIKFSSDFRFRLWQIR